CGAYPLSLGRRPGVRVGAFDDSRNLCGGDDPPTRRRVRVPDEIPVNQIRRTQSQQLLVSQGNNMLREHLPLKGRICLPEFNMIRTDGCQVTVNSATFRVAPSRPRVSVTGRRVRPERLLVLDGPIGHRLDPQSRWRIGITPFDGYLGVRRALRGPLDQGRHGYNDRHHASQYRQPASHGLLLHCVSHDPRCYGWASTWLNRIQSESPDAHAV